MEQQIPVNDISQDQPEKSAPSVFDKLPEPIREVGQKVVEAVREFRESETYGQMTDAGNKARDYITDNPVNSFFYALGAGFVLGFVLKRKK